ncbi:MAG: TrmB family transcriptional regulator [Promethearchaeota archaeon]
MGFTDYNTTILITLLRRGEMDARQLSEHTRVPYSRIYEVLNDMIKKGVLMKIEGRPSTYVANPPQEMLGNLKSKIDSEFQENSALVSDYLTQLYAPEKTNVEIPLTMYFGEKPNIRRLKTVVKNSSRQLVLFLQDGKFLPQVRDEMNYLKVTSVKVKLVVSGDFKEDAFFEELSSFAEIERVPAILGGYLALSDEEVVHWFFQGSFGFLKAKEDEYLGMSGTHPALHAIANHLVSR